MITLALAGIVIGILSSGTGLGGGFLVVPLLIFLGREAKLAVGTAFVFILMTATHTTRAEEAAVSRNCVSPARQRE